MTWSHPAREDVALRKESVDRNDKSWLKQSIHHKVALRKESVDRNFNAMQIVIVVMWSLSARRAWIEMSTVIVILRKRNTVALRKESVDRNYIIKITKSPPRRRSPQGERG